MVDFSLYFNNINKTNDYKPDSNGKYSETSGVNAESVFVTGNKLQLMKSSAGEKVPTVNPAPLQTAGDEAGAVNNIEPPSDIPMVEINRILDINAEYGERNKNKTIQLPDGKFYEFDEQGRVSNIFNEPPKEGTNGVTNSHIYITYNNNNTIEEVYRFENNGQIIDGQRVCGVYNNKGELKSYHVDSDFDPVSGDPGCQVVYDKVGNITQKAIVTFNQDGKRSKLELYDGSNNLKERHLYNEKGNAAESCYYDKAGNVTKKSTYRCDDNGNVLEAHTKYLYPEASEEARDIHNRLATLTVNNFDEVLNHINNRVIENVDESDREKDSILFVMNSYEAEYGQSLLEALAAKEPNGKELAQKLIGHIEDLCAPKQNDDDNLYKYTDDIKDDMASHPTDYKKLSVDLQRMLNRGWLSESENKNGDYGDNVVDINGKIDLQQNVKQNKVGDCYLIASIIELSQRPAGAKAIDEMIAKNEDGSVTVTFKGVNKSYTISQQELLDSDNFSVGDDDMRAIEIAFDKYRRDLAYESDDYMTQPDAEGGYLSDVTQAIFGKNAEDIEAGNLGINDFNNQNTAFTFSFNIDGTYNLANVSVKNAAGDVVQDKMMQNHEYAIVKSDENNVYFINPWDKNNLLSISIEEFRNMQGLNVSRFKFNPEVS